MVQGVGFRPFIYRTAVTKGLVGFVRNRGDASVEIVVEEKEDHVKHFLKDLRDKSPPLARIYEVIAKYGKEIRGLMLNLVQVWRKKEVMKKRGFMWIKKPN